MENEKSEIFLESQKHSFKRKIGPNNSPSSMSNRQIVAKSAGVLAPATRDQTKVHEWQLRLEQNLFEQLQRITTDPDFQFRIEQKTEACFKQLMDEGVHQLEQHAGNLSATADRELAIFKEKAGAHLEERILLVADAAHAEASAHAKQLQQDTEYHMNRHLQGLIAEAKSEAAGFALAEVKASVDRADAQLDRHAATAIHDMIQRFDGEARDRIGKLLEESYASARGVMQSFADDRVLEIRRRAKEEIERLVREVRSNEERSALSSISSQAAEETRQLAVAVATTMDAALRDVQKRHASALLSLDERAEFHSTAVQNAIQRQVRLAWEQSEIQIKSTINKDIATLFHKHSREVEEDLDERVRAAFRSLKKDDEIEKLLKAFVIEENQAQYARNEDRLQRELQRGMQEMQSRISELVSEMITKPETTSTGDYEIQFHAIKSVVRQAVEDLDEKIATLSRSIATTTATARPSSAAEENENHLANVRKELREALASIDAEVKAAVGRSAHVAATAKDSPDIGSRIQQEVQAAIDGLDQRLRAEIRESLVARAPVGITEVVMMEHEKDLEAVSRDAQDAIRSVKLERPVCTNAYETARPKADAWYGNTEKASPWGNGRDTSADLLAQYLAEKLAMSRATPPLGNKVSTGTSTQNKSHFDVEAQEIERAMQRAWDAAGEDNDDAPSTPGHLRTLAPNAICEFLGQYESYKKAGGRQGWTAFVRPGLMDFVRSCELDDDASDDDILAFLKQQASLHVRSDFADLAKLFESVQIDDGAEHPTDQVLSVLFGMEEVLSTNRRNGKHIQVPIQAYGRIALSKLPSSFKGLNFKGLTTKRQVKDVLLNAAAATD